VIINDLVECPALNMMVNNLYQLYTEEGRRKFLRNLFNAVAYYITLCIKSPQSNLTIKWYCDAQR